MNYFKRINIIGGVPATGKSALMKKIKKELKVDYFFEKDILKGYADKDKDNYIFGIYNNELFDGTDKLSMAVQPKAVEFIRATKFKSIFISIEFNCILNENLHSFLYQHQ